MTRIMHPSSHTTKGKRAGDEPGQLDPNRNEGFGQPGRRAVFTDSPNGARKGLGEYTGLKHLTKSCEVGKQYQSETHEKAGQ